MWMLNQFRNAGSRLWPASLKGLGLLLGSLCCSPGCIQSPPARRVVTEPAPPLLEGKTGVNERPGATEWRDPRDDSTPRLPVGADAVPSTGAPSDAVLLAEVDQAMDDWHQAASVGDRDRYIGHFAPDAVFLGTDATERWDMATLTAYVDKNFRPGAGWTYKPFNRHVMLGGGSQIAWMDEELDSDGYGALRGTGVLRRDGDVWKIVHYSMAFTIPNRVAREVVSVVRSGL